MSNAPRPATDRADTVHLFPGQGDFGLGPLLRALPAAPSLRRALAEVFEEADRAAAESGVAPLGPRLAAATPPSARELAAEPPGTLQLAQFGVCLAVHRALEEDGAVAGRFVSVSFGEIPALTAAGCCSVLDGARLACRLGQLLTAHGGGMTLLASGPFETRRLLGRSGPDAARTVLACVNHAGETVVSGPLPDLEATERCAAAMGVPYQRLRLPFMSHHPGLAEEAAAFERYARQLRWEAPRRPVFSAVAGRLHHARTDLPKALAHCLVKAFSLPTVLPSALNGAALAVELGTGGALASAVRAVTPGVRALAPLAESRWPAPSSAPDTASGRGAGAAAAPAAGVPASTATDAAAVTARGFAVPRTPAAHAARPARATRPHRPPSTSAGRKP